VDDRAGSGGGRNEGRSEDRCGHCRGQEGPLSRLKTSSLKVSETSHVALSLSVVGIASTAAQAYAGSHGEHGPAPRRHRLRLCDFAVMLKRGRAPVVRQINDFYLNIC